MPRGVSLYDEARLQGRLWTPALLQASGGIARWYDFSDFSTINGVSGRVASVFDKSGFGITASQNTAASRPFFEPVSVHPCGLSDIFFDNASEYFLLASAALPYNATSGVSWALVGSQNVNATNAFIGGAGAGNLELRISGTSSVDLLRRSQANLVSITGATLNNLLILGCDCSTNSSAVWLNGRSASSATNPALGDAGAFIGTASGGEQTRGRIGEVIGSQRRWTTGERQLIDGYLAWKWNVVASLPASQPYKNRPPLIGG